MSVLLHKLRTLAGFNQQQLLWFVPLYVLSGLMRLALLVLPFRVIAPWLGRNHANMAMTLLLTEEQENLSRRMGTVIRTLSKYTPWESKCLVQAMLARIVLGYYGIPHVIYLGVNQSGPPENPMSEDELSSKFLELVEMSLGSEKARAVLTNLNRLEELDSISDIIEMLEQ